jgi:hypothetical protein
LIFIENNFYKGYLEKLVTPRNLLKV